MNAFSELKKNGIVIALFFIGYAALYFFLKDKFLFTPDFSGTDAYHFNIAYKYQLWKSIRSGTIPFWTDLLNGGFPLLAESQMGTFFLPYYFIYPLFSSFTHAYAFLFSFHLFILTLGMYFLLRYLKTPHILSFLLTILFAWNGSITFRWVHFVVLQPFSFVPLLFLMYLKWNETHKTRYLTLISILINQMIFAGYIQIAFMALLGLSILYIVQNRPLRLNHTVALFGSVVFGIILSLPQILPTIQLSQYTGRMLFNSYTFAISAPFNMQNLCGFFSVNCLGSPQYGTYPLDWQTAGVYWENTPYIGPLFAIGIIFASVYYFISSKKENNQTMAYLFLFSFFFLLSLGGNSPLYFLFSLFPFTMFRVPPRYLLLTVFFLMLYSSFILKEILKKSTIISVCIYSMLLINCLMLINATFSYHLFVNTSVLYKTLTTQKVIKQGSLYITHGAQEAWHAIFAKQGWKSQQSVNDYLFINQALLPNSNLITGQANFDIYASLEMRRQMLVKTILIDGLNIATEKNIENNQSIKIENLLQLYGISSIISFKNLYLPNYKATQFIKKGENTITIYQSTQEGKAFYIPKTVKKVFNLDEMQESMYAGTLTQDNASAESLPYAITQSPSGSNINIIKKENNRQKGTISSPKGLFVVLRKSWYPEWKLTIDGKLEKIYKTNFIHMGFFVPKGKHTIELVYVPTSFYIGCGIAAAALILVGILIKKNQDLF